jgi:oxygen-dependent protoporphyrinogen oxidase
VVAVIGGGITGLSAARTLAVQSSGSAGSAAGPEIVLYDAAPGLGGKLHRTGLTDPDAGELPAGSADDPRFTVDVGAESMLARRPEALELVSELGLDNLRVHPTRARAQAFVDGRVRPLPPSSMGVPIDLDALQGYLSAEGVRRARREPELPAEPLVGDVEIGRYVAERFGDEVTDRVLEPILGGVYAGQARRLSFEAVHGSLFAEARTGGSLLAAARRLAAGAAGRGRDGAPGQDRTAAPVFAGLIGGVAGLVDALADDLARRNVSIRTGTTVRSIGRLADGRYQLVCGPAPAPESVIADRILLAIPAAPAARLLSGIVPDAAELLAGIPYASMAVITFVLADAGLEGSGLLVPPGELPTIKAFTYSHNKWAWIAEQAARRFGEGTAVARASVGRLGEEQLLQVDDEELIRRTLAEARQVPGWEQARLVRARVQRWGGGLPQYLLDHRRRIEDIRAAVGRTPGLAIAGAYTDGVGLPACIASGRRAVDALLG